MAGARWHSDGTRSPVVPERPGASRKEGRSTRVCSGSGGNALVLWEVTQAACTCDSPGRCEGLRIYHLGPGVSPQIHGQAHLAILKSVSYRN